MAGECGVILKVVEPIRSFVFDAVKEYVHYIGSCEENLVELHKCLSDVCNKKGDIYKKVKTGNDKQEEITREAASWLKDVRILSEDEELKLLMHKDTETAKYVVKMMGKMDLKRRLNKESEMQDVVIKVMKTLREEMENSEEEMRKIAEMDYKQVAEVVVEMMKDRIDEFKKIMKEDKQMAVVATRTLKDRDLDKLIKGDSEMEEIVREAANVSDEDELWRNLEDYQSTNEGGDGVGTSKNNNNNNNNRVKEAAKKLFTPLANLLTPLGKLMDDPNFKKAVSEAETVKLGLEVIDGLLVKGSVRVSKLESDETNNRGCSLSICDHYHGRYKISKSAEFMAKHIKDEVISKCPRDPVTLRIRTVDLKPIPTQFLKSMDSRAKLLDRILVGLNDDQVHAFGVFGMGGTGKTTLAKEVIRRVGDIFSIKVMVEVSDTPDIVRIQAAIAESIDLPLHDVENVAQRAMRLYNRLISEEKKKVLVTLDNVWRKINLDVIGIPRACKLLLTARDREVCRVMDVHDSNILEVGMLDKDEALSLFKSQAGNQVDGREYRPVVDRLLSKCGGLPLAIVAAASSLKDKELYSWEKFADDLEKPFSSQQAMGGDYRRTYSILDTSYKFIEDEDKRLFFLLACLSPIGSSTSVESLMRYGIGLSLFQHVNKLSEAMEQADTWANELVQSSMLLEGDFKRSFKIHDVVRAFAISFAAEEDGHKFIVEGIPRWLENESFKKYTAMSLISKNDYSRLSGVEASRLRILILKGDLSPDLDDSYFNGMLNLEVLALSNMDFHPSLPESMRRLKKLRTLCMEGCKLADIKLVGELISLRVLSLCESFLDKVPDEVGELCDLRLLDLNGCRCREAPLIRSTVLGKLSKLEGLYMFVHNHMLLSTKLYDIDDDEKIRLPFLNVLEIKVAETQMVPIHGDSLQNVDKSRVCVENWNLNDQDLQQYCRVLYLNNVQDVNGFLEKSCHKLLLKKVDFMTMKSSKNFEQLVPQLDQEGFRDLRFLDLRYCSDLKYIVDGRAMKGLVAFPCLRLLRLYALESLKVVCDGEVSPGTFLNLQTLRVSFLDQLSYVLPLVPHNLIEIAVSRCKVLNFIFIEEEETRVVNMPFLKKLKLSQLPCLLSLVGPKEFSGDSDALQGRQIFFDGTIVLPSLELLELVGCGKVVTLWSMEIIPASGFHNLKSLKIENCEKLASLGSYSVISILVQLETLSITRCDEMREIIAVEEINEPENGEQIITFPLLKYLELGYLDKLESFYGGRSKLEFPSLKKLEMVFLNNMRKFADSENCTALFHEKINFPCLEELLVRSVSDEVMGLWDVQSFSVDSKSFASNPAPVLKQLMLGETAGLRHIPSTILKNLSSLKLVDFDDDNDVAVFASSDLEAKDGCIWTCSQLQNLVELRVESTRGSWSLKELFGKENSNGSDDALRLFCGKVKILELKALQSLNRVPLCLFKGLASLTLFGLTWEYVVSADALKDSLQHLEYLEIDRCSNMEVLVITVGSEIRLPRLKGLKLKSLLRAKSISSTANEETVLLLPSLESLEISVCVEMEHFWSGSFVAPRLQSVSLKGCNKLQQLLVGKSEDIIELSSLQTVYIDECPMMKFISSRTLITPKLRDLTLRECSSMQSLFPRNPNDNDDLQLLSLETVVIQRCRLFSLERLLAPKLTRVRYDRREYSKLQYNDLSHILQNSNVE
ncbi:hypothetical protein vseg_007340 [Gypsophila vaccaria]